MRALGGRGFNGGVQLLALDKMRASQHYGQLLWKHARRQLPMKPGGIGWLGARHYAALSPRHTQDTFRNTPPPSQQPSPLQHSLPSQLRPSQQ